MKIRNVPFLILAFLILNGCGYELVTQPGILTGTSTSTTSPEGAVPIKINSVSLPVFKNTTFEPQVPMFFTEAFSQELAGSGLVEVNKPGADAVLQGTVNSVSTIISSLSATGLAIGKTVTVLITLTLAQQGKVVKTWTFGDAEVYDATTINNEDYNKRAALTRIAARMARRFHAQLATTL